MTKFKICGLSHVDHVLAAANAGADYLGFVFVQGVRRELSIQNATHLIEEYRCMSGDGGPKLVGLFANQPIQYVNNTVSKVGLDMVQLCGNEPPKYWNDINVPVIKQIKVKEEGSLQKTIAGITQLVKQVCNNGQIPLLDKYHDGHLGGTGTQFDWNIAAEITKTHNIFLAGGLTPENVRDAIRTVTPWGVDVSSGIETDNTKDTKKIISFAEEVTQADQEISE